MTRLTHSTWGVAGIAVALFLPSLLRGDDATASRGREVYIAEGCINCHSQYVRPEVPADVLMWGPVRPLAEVRADTPPLVGLRRQGPDLMNVGNRRTAEWMRLHLIAPQAVAPGSRMPSYAHLFRPGDPRGEALVAYLSTLGAGTLLEHQEQSLGWTPAESVRTEPYAEPAARRRFTQLCVSCHGPAGHGDGPVAGQLSRRPPDFSREPWRHVRPAELATPEALARIIKFGVPGTAMAGHEYLDDATVVLLARYAASLHR